jgi:ubiquinone/menaquinone biosynthesis C-methylase UbiE
MNGDSKDDIWSHWLLEARFGGDPAMRDFVLQGVQRYRDRVLDDARLQPGMTLADIGTGDGLIAFGAIDRIGPNLGVILTDVSTPLLQHAEQTAIARGVRAQCLFLPGSADKLEGIGTQTIDVVTARAVLAYVADKRTAFREFFRVLKPGGRFSIAEPILQDEAFEACALTKLIATQPEHPDWQFLRLLQKWKAAQYPTTEEQVWRSPITNYSERDLMRFAREAGFAEIHLELHMDYRTHYAHEGAAAANWEVFLALSPHPWAPPLKQILAEKFTPEERRLFEQVMRPNVEERRWARSEIVAYITGEKSKA